MASRRKNVPAARVREWAATPEGAKAIEKAEAKFPGSRGRLDPSTIAAFHKANPRERYETGAAEHATVTVPVVTLDKAGRKRTKEVTITTSEARAALGQPTSQRGRLPLGDLSDVLSQREAEQFAASFK